MKTREINPQQKMGQVIQAARTLFVTQGYHNVSIPQIVSASGVSIGAIYHHFTNKEGLARALHQQTLHQFQAWFDERISGCSATRDKLRAFSDLVLEITEQDPEMMEYMLLTKHGEFLSEEPPICATAPFLTIQQIIGAGIERKELRQGDSFLSAIAFTGVILRAVELRLTGVMQQNTTDMADELFRYAWAAIEA